MLAGGERRRRFDGVDAHDGAAQALLVGADARGKVGHRRLVAELAAQRFARRVELAALAADAARPGVLAERVDHRAANAPFGERLELDPAIFVEAVRGVDQTEHAVLDEITDVDRVRHRGGHAPSKRFDEWNSGDDAMFPIGGGDRLGAHELSWLRTRKLVPVASGYCSLPQWRYQQSRLVFQGSPHHLVIAA